jgi:hypothetical protein
MLNVTVGARGHIEDRSRIASNFGAVKQVECWLRPTDDCWPREYSSLPRPTGAPPKGTKTQSKCHRGWPVDIEGNSSRLRIFMRSPVVSCT